MEKHIRKLRRFHGQILNSWFSVTQPYMVHVTYVTVHISQKVGIMFGHWGSKRWFAGWLRKFDEICPKCRAMAAKGQVLSGYPFHVAKSWELQSGCMCSCLWQQSWLPWALSQRGIPGSQCFWQYWWPGHCYWSRPLAERGKCFVEQIIYIINTYIYIYLYIYLYIIYRAYEIM